MEFEAGIPVAPLKQTGTTTKRGTKITFRPDSSIFETTDYSFEKLSERLREKAFLNKGIRILIKDEREAPEKSHEFYYKGGIAEFVKHLNKNKSPLHDEPLYFEHIADDLSIEVSMQYNDSYDEKIFSFANNINTVDGGTHLSGFRGAITRTINNYAESSGMTKNAKVVLSGDDVREGLVAIISVKIPQPQFEGQTKGKLNSPVKGPVESFLNEKLGEFFEQNPGVAKKIVGKAVDAARAREAARKAREIVRKSDGLVDAARQAGRLPGKRPGPERDLHRRGRFGRRLGQTGPRPQEPGRSAAQGQDPECRKGAIRQDARPRRDQGVDHRARHRHRQGGF